VKQRGTHRLANDSPSFTPVHPRIRAIGPRDLHLWKGRGLGWIKQWSGLRKFKVRGSEKVSAVFGLHVIAYNLIRLGNLLMPAMAAA
jgi:hypothetical protein